MATKKAKRYSDAKKKEILDFIAAEGRGGQTKAVEKFGVTPATIASWKKKADTSASRAKTTGGASKELKILQQMTELLVQIEAKEAELAKLKKNYDAMRAAI